jgi:hypothetical protein
MIGFMTRAHAQMNRDAGLILPSSEFAFHLLPVFTFQTICAATSQPDFC